MKSRTILLLLPVLAASALSCSASNTDRDGPAAAPDASKSVARTMKDVDPCTILAKKRFEELLSASLDEPSPKGFHTCVWQHVRDNTGKDFGIFIITRTAPNTDGTPTMLAGSKALINNEGGGTNCQVDVLLDPSYESMALGVNFTTYGERKDACQIAQRVAAEVYEKLPAA